MCNRHSFRLVYPKKSPGNTVFFLLAGSVPRARQKPADFEICGLSNGARDIRTHGTVIIALCGGLTVPARHWPYGQVQMMAFPMSRRKRLYVPGGERWEPLAGSWAGGETCCGCCPGVHRRHAQFNTIVEVVDVDDEIDEDVFQIT